MKFITRFFLLCSIFTAVQCIQLSGKKVKGDREVTSKKIEVDAFNELELSSGWEVQLIPHHSNEIVLKSDKNLLDYLIVNQDKKHLSIGADKIVGYAKEKLVQVYYKDTLNKIKALNQVEVFSEEKLYFHTIDIEALKSAKLDLELEADSISIEGSSDADVSLEASSKDLVILSDSSADIKVDGNNKIVNVEAFSDSDVTLKGEGEKANYEAKSRAKINAKNFKVNNIIANATSSGKIKCYPVDSFEAKASTDSKITYHNDPSSTINSQAESGGSIERKWPGL